MTGSIRSIGTALVLAGLTAALAAQAPKMNVKMGLWEMTSSMQISGDMPGMPDMSKMTPEQQAQMKAAVGAMAQPTTDTRKSCLTKEKFEQGQMMADPQHGTPHDCKLTVVVNTSSAYDVKVACGDKGTTAGTYHFEAPTSDTVRGKMDMQTMSQGKTMKVAGTFTGKWLGADCGNIK